MQLIARIWYKSKWLYHRILNGLLVDVYFGKHMSSVPNHSIVFFPCHEHILCCGITGIVSFKNKKAADDHTDLVVLKGMLEKLEICRSENCKQNNLCFKDHFLGGKGHVDSLLRAVRTLKRNGAFYDFFTDDKSQNELAGFARRLSGVVDSESKYLVDHMGHLDSEEVDILIQRIDNLKDIAWCLASEIIGNIKKINNLLGHENKEPNITVVSIFKQINSVLNSIDRLEVRGRDSAGISMMFILDGKEYDRFKQALDKMNLVDQLTKRSAQDVLVNSGININQITDENNQRRVTLALTYKVAAEVGRLGDNIRFIRKQIKNDEMLQRLV